MAIFRFAPEERCFLIEMRGESGEHESSKFEKRKVYHYACKVGILIHQLREEGAKKSEERPRATIAQEKK